VSMFEGLLAKFAVYRHPILGFAWIAAVLLISLSIPIGSPWPLRISLALLLLAVVLRGSWPIFAAVLLFSLIYWGPTFYPKGVWFVPTASLLLPLGFVALLSLAFGSRGWVSWFKKGEMDSISRLLVALISVVSAVVLLLWAAWSDNLGAGEGMVRELRGVPVWFLVFLGVPLFAFLNALVEEVIYRGFLQSSLETVLPGSRLGVVVIQASAFAAAHFAAGFPNGPSGYLLAFAYGLAMGYLRFRTGGLLAPFLAHLAADMVIGFTLILLAS
jgi:uncharacterized protein